jgi:hypothetical protein
MLVTAMYFLGQVTCYKVNRLLCMFPWDPSNMKVREIGKSWQQISLQMDVYFYAHHVLE